MSTALHDGGARVLPRPADERATVTSWAAHLACDADLRAVAEPYRSLASRLTIGIALISLCITDIRAGGLTAWEERDPS